MKHIAITIEFPPSQIKRLPQLSGVEKNDCKEFPIKKNFYLFVYILTEIQ